MGALTASRRASSSAERSDGASAVASAVPINCLREIEIGIFMASVRINEFIRVEKHVTEIDERFRFTIHPFADAFECLVVKKRQS